MVCVEDMSQRQQCFVEEYQEGRGDVCSGSRGSPMYKKHG